MKKLIFYAVLFLFVLCSSFNPKTNCELEYKTLFHVQFAIASSDYYPVMIAGVSESFHSFSKKNQEMFFKSFYSNYDYTSDMYMVREATINECFNQKTNKDEYQKIISYMSQKYQHNFHLATGEVVNIRVSKLSGTFIVVDKSFKTIGTNSLEINIQEIAEISKVYIPYKIESVEKLKRKEVKRLLKNDL